MAGSIEVGKVGDLAALGEDLMACAAGRIKEIKVAATVLGGKVVFEAK
jgi:predicted amidohydrolase YtcJ